MRVVSPRLPRGPSDRSRRRHERRRRLRADRQGLELGRWGADDELGTANPITSRERVEAVACVRTRKVFSLAVDFEPDTSQFRASYRLNPPALDELAVDCRADDVFEFLFAAPPLPFVGAVGSPVNPLTVK